MGNSSKSATVKVTGPWPRQGGGETAHLSAQRCGTARSQVAHLICSHVYGALKHGPGILRSFGLAERRRQAPAEKELTA